MPVDAPADSSTDQQRREISRVLALGIIRLHRRQLLDPTDPPRKDLSESVRRGLEVSRETVLSVTSG